MAGIVSGVFLGMVVVWCGVRERLRMYDCIILRLNRLGGGKVMLTSRGGKRSADLVKSVKAEDSPL